MAEHPEAAVDADAGVPPTMVAARLVPGGLEVVRDAPVPRIGAGEVLARVRMAGICGTDIEMMRGYADGVGHIPGHEFVADVIRGDEPAWLGRRIVASINHVPGSSGVKPEHHPDRRVIGIRGHEGAFAEYVRLPMANLIAVPESVDDALAVLAEPLAAALRITQQVDLPRGRTVGVVGPGRLGMLIAWCLADRGADVRLIGRSEASLELGRRWGLRAALVQDVEDDSLEVVVEATGSVSGVAESLRVCRAEHTIVLKSTWNAGTAPALDLSPVVVKELRVQGSRCGPVDEAVGLLRSAVPFADLLDARYPLDQAHLAAEHAQRRSVRKVVLVNEAA